MQSVKIWMFPANRFDHCGCPSIRVTVNGGIYYAEALQPEDVAITKCDAEHSVRREQRGKTMRCRGRAEDDRGTLRAIVLVRATIDVPDRVARLALMASITEHWLSAAESPNEKEISHRRVLQ